MAATSVTVIFGAGGMGRYTHEIGHRYLEILERNNVRDIDTAYVYASLLPS